MPRGRGGGSDRRSGGKAGRGGAKGTNREVFQFSPRNVTEETAREGASRRSGGRRCDGRRRFAAEEPHDLEGLHGRWTALEGWRGRQVGPQRGDHVRCLENGLGGLRRLGGLGGLGKKLGGGLQDGLLERGLHHEVLPVARLAPQHGLRGLLGSNVAMVSEQAIGLLAP